MQGLTARARLAVESMRLEGVRSHAEVQRVTHETVSWATRRGLASGDAELAHVQATRVGELAAFVCEREPIEVVQLSADLITWLFRFDDLVGEARPGISTPQHRDVLRSYERVICEQRLPSAPTGFHEALLDVVERAVALGASADWIRRFALDMADYFEGCAAESEYRHAHRVPSLEAYRSLRARTVGTRPVFAIMELGVCGLVPRAEMAHLEFESARTLAALLTAWVNDVYSLPKELAARDPLNLVVVLANEHAVAIEDALELAIELYNSDLSLLERTVAQLRGQRPSIALDGYLAGLLAWVHGNRHWTKFCGRYL